MASVDESTTMVVVESFPGMNFGVLELREESLMVKGAAVALRAEVEERLDLGVTVTL